MSPELAVPVAFPHRSGAHCGSTALAALLRFHELTWDDGSPLTEADAFGVAGGLDVFFSDDLVVGVPLYLLGRSATLEADLCAHVGATLDLRRTDDPGEGERWLRDELAAGRPTMIWADIRALDYLDVQMVNANHVVVVTAVDDDGATVADFAFDELQRCSRASLAAARASTGWPRPARHATFCAEFPAMLPPRAQLVRAGVARALANMRASSSPESPGVFGLTGLEAFLEAFRDARTLPEDELADVLRRVHFCIARAGTGGALFRSLQAQFLSDAAVALDDPGLHALADTYRLAADAWREVTAGDRNAPRSMHRHGLFAAQRAAELERAGVEAMQAWLDATEPAPC